MSSKKVLLGVVVGAAAGAVVGMLVAPVKGAVARKRLAREVSDYVEDAQESLDDYVEGATEAYGTVKEGVKDLVDKGKKKAASVAGTIRARR